MISTISKNIKYYRKKMGYTQAELAKGICTQAMISNFEKGGSSPSSVVMHQIAEKLGVPIENFFHGEHSTPVQQNTEVEKLVRKLIHQRDYESVSYIIMNELNKKNVHSPREQKFLKLNEGICIYFLERDSIKSTQILKSLLPPQDKVEEALDIEIISSLAIIYFEMKDYDTSLYYYELCTKNFEQNKIDARLKIKILYGKSRTLTYKEEFKDALLCCKQAIKICLENETLYFLGELLFQAARLSILEKASTEAEIYIRQATSLFELQGEIDFLRIVEQLKEELQ
ncbi:helix-turn-helix domain-containing protein [Metasolibacillus meyeri]|uniref:Helix-turn-helix domain-containing protein n=1 Tax=Metasolibacillus meyeri TaxID=1071052 RepID=A0AAW9NEX0_9BACL|nr:helix-turn-helix domain-containing protein [Metasolibacillus meyeri]MEC1176884.1 helix-turn-helix domain-containing protein [Metasolibacillus meyeri]